MENVLFYGVRLGSLALLLSSPLALASAITNGTIYIGRASGNLPDGFFELSGQGFSLSAPIKGGWWMPLHSSAWPTGFLSIDGEISGLSMSVGSAEVFHSSFPTIGWGDFFAASGSLLRITGDPLVLDHGEGTYSGTFAFEGWFCGVLPDSRLRPRPCVVDLPAVTGLGAVFVTSVEDPSSPPYRLVAATYVFDSPEPSTFFGGALSLVIAVLAIRRRTR